MGIIPRSALPVYTSIDKFAQWQGSRSLRGSNDAMHIHGGTYNCALRFPLHLELWWLSLGFNDCPWQVWNDNGCSPSRTYAQFQQLPGTAEEFCLGSWWRRCTHGPNAFIACDLSRHIFESSSRSLPSTPFYSLKREMLSPRGLGQPP